MRARSALGSAAAVVAAGTLLGVSALAGTADRPPAVALAYSPAVGTVLRYETEVVSTTVTDVTGQPTDTSRQEADLDVRQEVVGSSSEGAQVDVALTQAGIGTRRFTVTFDRAAQLSSFEAVEGVPAEAVGDLGLTDVFPPGAGAPPDRPLAPGDRWRIDAAVPLQGGDAPVRLVGEGRLLSLDVEDGRETATVASRTRLPVATARLDGVQLTEVVATYDLADGTVRRSKAVTTGLYRVLLAPPGDTSGDPVEGTLRVELRSTTRRVG